jgi:hypothetical protein
VLQPVDAAASAAEPTPAGAEPVADDRADVGDGLVVVFGRTHLCRRCMQTAALPGVCCRRRMTPMQVQLHQVRT